jgi:cell division protein FtsW (lipid II flippase)
MSAFEENAKQFWDWCLSLDFKAVSGYYTLILRWIFPLLAVAIFLRCILPLLQVKKSETVWGYLDMADGTRKPLNHWENSIGRSKLSDVVVDFAFASRSHAVLTFQSGVWTISDLSSKGGVRVNGEKIENSGTVMFGDVISLSGLEMTLNPPDGQTIESVRQQEAKTVNRIQIQGDTSDISSGAASARIRAGVTLWLIILSQILGGLQIWISMGNDKKPAVPIAFTAYIVIELLYYLIMRRFSRKSFELELLSYFLCGANLLIVAAAFPHSLYKQLVAIVFGMAVYTVLGIIMYDLARARKLKYILAAGALLLLVLNLAIGETRYGAKNWINLRFITFQPLEFVKVAFVLAGTATLDRLLTKQNMTAFIGFSGACICALVLMRDLGTAVVFFGTFIVIAFMRSGDIRTIALISSGAVLGAIAAIVFLPYIAVRFATWGNAWDFVNDACYQQTRTMIYAASGGLLGIGGGNGYLVNVAAADTDLVFGVLCEEWGLIVALITILIVVFFGVYAVFLTKSCRSSFYAIAACGAASVYLIQTVLNVLGSMDILPLTGVTIPFVSNGGSSMIASWGLLAFIKAADGKGANR